jgi:hypothetical protein
MIINYRLEVLESRAHSICKHVRGCVWLEKNTMRTNMNRLKRSQCVANGQVHSSLYVGRLANSTEVHQSGTGLSFIVQYILSNPEKLEAE